MDNRKIVIELPLDIALEIATYGEYGKISRFVQKLFEKQIVEKGFKQDLLNTQDQKLEKLKENLSRTLGGDVMKKVDDAIQTGVEAIKVANRLTKN
jgi:hypothetical protein